MPVLEKASNIARRRGPRTAIGAGVGFLYNRTVRPLLPETDEWVRYNGVKFRRRRVGDALVPFPTQGSEADVDYEVALGRAVRSHVSAGESVLEIGGGYGVTATIAARQVGDRGRVVTYEGAPTLAREAVATVERNGVDDRVTVRNRVVGGTGEWVRGGSGAVAAPVAVEDLPAADVLVVDCDGGEFDLVESIDAVDADCAIVEHHAVSNVDPPVAYEPDRVRAILETRGYAIETTYTRAMDPSIPEFGDEETVFVAVG